MADHSLKMVYKSGQGFYTGKVIGDSFFKNFKLNTSVLWSKQEFGINVEIFDYLKEHGVKSIVYVDTSSKKDAYKISLQDFDSKKVEKEFKFGRQYFVGTSEFEKITAPKLPFVQRTIEVKEQ